MTKEQLLALGITEEQATKILEGYKNHIPKDRFDQVNNEKNELKTQIADRDKQLETIKKGAGDNEELKKQIETLQNENKTVKADYDKKIQDIQLNTAVETALRNAKAKNLTATKALIDYSKLKLEGDKVTGLEEQIKAHTEAEETKFLFDVATTTTTTTGGFIPANVSNPTDPNFKNPFSKEHFNLTEQGKIYKENREMAEQLKTLATTN